MVWVTRGFRVQGLFRAHVLVALQSRIVTVPGCGDSIRVMTLSVTAQVTSQVMVPGRPSSPI